MDFLEVLKALFWLILSEITAFFIAIIVGFPLLVVIILISNWIYKKFAKRFEEEIKKRYQDNIKQE
ncbi:hypothetical protein JCM9492_07480 [Aquifex pyrophilus]